MEFPSISITERKNFSDRLRTALRDNNISPKASTLARDFNLLGQGASVTPHAVRKWLLGEAIPTQEKILIFSRWLDVSAAWLRFGDAENTQFTQTGRTDELSAFHATAIIRAIAELSKPSQKVVKDLVDSLKRLENTLGLHKSEKRE